MVCKIVLMSQTFLLFYFFLNIKQFVDNVHLENAELCDACICVGNFFATFLISTFYAMIHFYCQRVF